MNVGMMTPSLVSLCRHHAILGVILFVQALTLMKLLRETAAVPSDFAIAIPVGVLAMGVPYGYLIGMIVGSLLTRVTGRWGIGG